MIPEVSRAFPDSPHGHLEDLRTDPVGLLLRLREECGNPRLKRYYDEAIRQTLAGVRDERLPHQFLRVLLWVLLVFFAVKPVSFALVRARLVVARFSITVLGLRFAAFFLVAFLMESP